MNLDDRFSRPLLIALKCIVILPKTERDLREFLLNTSTAFNIDRVSLFLRGREKNKSYSEFDNFNTNYSKETNTLRETLEQVDIKRGIEGGKNYLHIILLKK